MPSSRPARVPDADLDELRRRLAATRFAHLPAGLGWSRGTDAGYLAELIRFWRDDYDWRVHEARILDLPWESAGSEDRELRFVHTRSANADAPAIVLLHGWPDSVLRFERVLPLLEGFHTVVPALPGFPFAPLLTTPDTNVRVIASMVAYTMAQLGYDKYVISAGDVGGLVAEQLAAAYPDRVAALHLTNISPRHAAFSARSAMSEEESAYLDRLAAWQRAEGGYIAEQSTKPHTLAVGLADSPAGLAAWITEKLQSWSDNDGNVESAFAREDLLTWITAYWLTDSIGTSFGTYTDTTPPVAYLKTPTVISSFAHDNTPAPRTFVERFINVKLWIEHGAGGHFAAWELPAAYAADLREAAALGASS